jgi:hypothetical protein
MLLVAKPNRLHYCRWLFIRWFHSISDMFDGLLWFSHVDFVFVGLLE